MKKKFLIPGLVLVLVIATIAVLYYLPVAKEPVEPKPESSFLYEILAGAGIEDAVVDISPERVLIRYNLPENMSKEAIEYYIMGAAATAVPESGKIVIQTYENFEPLEEVTVVTKDVLAFMDKSITLDKLKERTKIKPLK